MGADHRDHADNKSGAEDRSHPPGVEERPPAGEIRLLGAPWSACSDNGMAGPAHPYALLAASECFSERRVTHRPDVLRRHRCVGFVQLSRKIGANDTAQDQRGTQHEKNRYRGLRRDPRPVAEHDLPQEKQHHEEAADEAHHASDPDLHRPHEGVIGTSALLHEALDEVFAASDRWHPPRRLPSGAGGPEPGAR